MNSRKCWILVPILTLLCVCSLSAQEASPLVGHWKYLGAEKDGKPLPSRFLPPNAKPLRSESVLKISLGQSTVRITNQLTIFPEDGPPRLMDNSTVEYELHGPMELKDGSGYWSASIEGRTMMMTKRSDGKDKSRMRFTVSDDGQQLVKTVEQLDPTDCRVQTISSETENTTKTKKKVKKVKCDEILGVSDVYVRVAS